MWLSRFRLHQKLTNVAEIKTSCEPRAKRFRLDSMVSFTEDGRKYEGHCLNVSASGLLARFEPSRAPDLWTEGRLSMEAGDHYLSIDARVARFQEESVAFAFSFETDNDRATIKILLDSVSDYPVADDAAYL